MNTSSVTVHSQIGHMSPWADYIGLSICAQWITNKLLRQSLFRMSWKFFVHWKVWKKLCLNPSEFNSRILQSVFASGMNDHCISIWYLCCWAFGVMSFDWLFKCLQQNNVMSREMRKTMGIPSPSPTPSPMATPLLLCEFWDVPSDIVSLPECCVVTSELTALEDEWTGEGEEGEDGGQDNESNDDIRRPELVAFVGILKPPLIVTVNIVAVAFEATVVIFMLPLVVFML